MTRSIAAPTSREGHRARTLLAALTLFYMSSFIDRAILNILAEPIKLDLHLTDTQLGVLGGIAFAAIYSTLGIPAARLAERKNRLTIITAALAIWSVMTMLCAAATSFLQLALARAGVGVGEAACTPCAHSMIGDSFPAQKRATALSIYSLGIPIGTLMGVLAGAWLAESYSWRVGFLAVGAPGLLLAVVAKVALDEPTRGRYDPPATGEVPSLKHTIHHLWSRNAFRHLITGVAVSTMISAGQGAFGAPYLLRATFGLRLSEVALVIAALVGCSSFVGTLTGGPLADWLSKRDVRLMLGLPAMAYVISAAALTTAFYLDNLPAYIGFSIVGTLGAAIYLGPTFGALHNMVEPRMRATAVAIVLMFAALIGYGLGPVLVGWLSDYAAHNFYGVDPTKCAGAAAPECARGSFNGLRLAMIVTSALYLWPAYHFYKAALRLKESLVTSKAIEPSAPQGES